VVECHVPVGDDTNIITKYKFIYKSKTCTSEQLESQHSNALSPRPHDQSHVAIQLNTGSSHRSNRATDAFCWIYSECFERKLASLQLEIEPFQVQHYLLLLTLMSSETDSDQLLLELYSVAHSQPARLHVLMKLNRTLRELLFRLTELDDEVPEQFQLDLLVVLFVISIYCTCSCSLHRISSHLIIVR